MALRQVVYQLLLLRAWTESKSGSMPRRSSADCIFLESRQWFQRRTEAKGRAPQTQTHRIRMGFCSMLAFPGGNEFSTW